MEIFRIEEFAKMKNPTPGTTFSQEIVASAQKAKNLGGIFEIVPPGSQVPYHLHRKRESIIIVVSGEATEIVEGKEFHIKPNDVLYIPVEEKHMVVNRTDKDYCYIELFTYPDISDFIEVK